MTDIRTPMTFDAIMSYSKSNRETYKELKAAVLREGTRCTPFVGAGLSVPFGGVKWGGLLRKLLDGYDYDANEKKNIKDKIEKNELIEAASAIKQQIGASQVLQGLRQIVPQSDRDKVKFKSAFAGSAVRLLAYLFNTGVITTNYDDVIEYAYKMAGIDLSVFHHYDIVETGRAMQIGTNVLFKIHGTVGAYTDYKRLVFDEEQYQIYDDPNSALVSQLRQQFGANVFLFLGCSLEKDRTVELFQRITSEHVGSEHFAIISCAQNKLVSRARELTDEMKIFPIFYPEERHECVRIILEQLLKECYPDRYKLIAPAPRSTLSAFHYNSDKFKFCGREEELKRLREFFDSKGEFKWWAITGAGGAGKSRLAFEFGKIIREDGCTAITLTDQDYRKLETGSFDLLDQAAGDILIIADYINRHIKAIESLLRNISERELCHKVRLLMIERSGKNLDDASWLSIAGYDSSTNLFRETCYGRDFLVLKPMNDEDLTAIMQSYVGEIYEESKTLGLSDDEADRLIAKLKEIDPELKRPLYGLFLADAWARDEHIMNWDKTKILDYVCNHENDYFADRINSLDMRPRDKLLIDELRAIATIRGDINLEMLKSGYAEVYSELSKAADDNGAIDEKDLLDRVGLLNSDGSAIEAVRPDLVGEYFVYFYLKNRHKTRFNAHELIYASNWYNDIKLIDFIARAISDFSELRDAELKHLADLSRSDLYAARGFAAILFAQTYLVQDVSVVEEIVGKLKALYEEYSSNEEIAHRYAKGLVNLSAEQDEAGIEHTVGKLKALYEEYSSNGEIALEYAQGLVNLSAKQDAVGGEQIIDKLKALYEGYRSNEKIALAYAQGLFNLSNKQDAACGGRTVDKLKALYKEYSSNGEIALVYAQGLVNLSNKQDAACGGRTVEKLKALYEEYRSNEEIALVYAQGLVNLSAKQDEVGGEHTVDKLKALYEEYSSNEEIALVYAKGLVNLSAKQDAVGGEQTIDKLEALYEGYSSNGEIALEYAKGLVNLSAKQDAVGGEQTIDKLEALYEEYSSNEEIALAYAQGLVNLSAKQDAVGGEHTVGKLEALHGEYRNNEEIAHTYAAGLFNLSIEQDEAGRESTVGKLKALHEEYRSNEEIALEYAKGKVNLAEEMMAMGEDISAIIAELEDIYSRFPNGLIEELIGLLNEE